MLDELLEEGFLEPIDLYFADMHQPTVLADRIFLCAVMQAARDGHICLDLESIRTPEGPFSSRWKEMVLLSAEKKMASPYLKWEGGSVYLEKQYQYETDVIDELKRLMGPSPLPKVKTALSDEQQAAFDLVRSENVSIIEGGPGTGKTYLTTELAKSFAQGRVILTAPTGKAAARLKERNPQALCGTLHSILGIPSDHRKQRSFVQADLIVVDEASMLDAKMMRFLLRSLETGQRIVFLGDSHQLPPVEIGSLFCDLIDLVPTAHLKTCRRSDRKEILDLARSIMEGEAPMPQDVLSLEKVKEFARAHLKDGIILTPLREGTWGVKELNLRIDQMFRLLDQEERLAPIMITRNDHESRLFNGDMGLMFFFHDKPLYAVFQIGGAVQQFLPSALPAYEMAYVLSVHKSQGSEFDHVLVLAPSGMEQFGKELLYTAVTRARHSVTLLGEEGVIAKTVQYSSCRRSGLKKRWSLI